MLRHDHKPGEKTFVDSAGDMVPVYYRASGEATPASIFVAVLGAAHTPSHAPRREKRMSLQRVPRVVRTALVITARIIAALAIASAIEAQNDTSTLDATNASSVLGDWTLTIKAGRLSRYFRCVPRVANPA